VARNVTADLTALKRLGRHLVHRYLAAIGMADGPPSAKFYVYLDRGAPGATEADFEGMEFAEEADGWGTGWVEVTVTGDEYRRFLKPDGEIVEVPFGEHTEEEDDGS
jgi:hypothetical protein